MARSATSLSTRQRLVAPDHLGGQLADAGLELLRIEELGRDRVDGVEAFDLLGAESLLQLVDLAVAGPVADIGAHAQPLLLRLTKEERNVGVVARVEEYVGPDRPELGHERGEVGRAGRVAFLEDHIEPQLLGPRLVAERHVGAVGAVLVDDGQPQLLGRLLELLLRELVDVLDRQRAELVTGGLGAEGVLEVASVEDLGRYGRGDPEELLLLVDALGDGNGVGARVDAGQDVHLLDAEQALGLVDGDVGLGLAVAVHLHDLVLADHAAPLVDEVDHHLGAAPAVERAAGGKGARVVVEQADLDGLGLGVGQVARCEPAAGAGDHEQDEDNAEDLHTRASFGCGHASGRSEAVPKKVPNPSTHARANQLARRRAVTSHSRPRRRSGEAGGGPASTMSKNGARVASMPSRDTGKGGPSVPSLRG